TNVRDLGEDAARNSQRCRSERFTDGESDKAWARVVARHKEQNEEHDEQLNAHQEHADAHAGFERNRIQREGLAAESGEGSAGVGESIYADTEPGHAIAAENAEDRKSTRLNSSHLGISYAVFCLK